MTDATKDTTKNQVESEAKEEVKTNEAQNSGNGDDQKKDNQKEEDSKPEPNPERGTLFDMRSKEEIAEEKRLANLTESQRKTEKSRKEQEEKRKEAEKKKKEQENRVYEAGTKLRYVGHLGRENIELEEPMNKKQVIAFLQDDYPEVTESRAKWRFDEDKKQIVVTMGSFDKGSCNGDALLHRDRP
jgi:hypothetical protein